MIVTHNSKNHIIYGEEGGLYAPDYVVYGRKVLAPGEKLSITLLYATSLLGIDADPLAPKAPEVDVSRQTDWFLTGDFEVTRYYDGDCDGVGYDCALNVPYMGFIGSESTRLNTFWLGAEGDPAYPAL